MQQSSDARRLIPALPAALAFTLGLAGCTTDRLSEPGQTADEQLLISTAIDHVVDRLNPNIPAGTKVFVDGQFFDNAPGDAALYSKYAIGSVRDLLLRRGARLVNDRKAAEVVAEVRTRAQSINHHDVIVGIPAVPVPVAFDGTVSTPKVAFYERDQQTGIAKMAITAYGSDGALVTSTGPAFGESHSTRFDLLFLFGWSDQDLLPKDMKR